ncbi:MAG: hypothetical protein JWO46_2713, partial [Nocardioidaceae bacterium]|nr:hypothetical protein [Nocardioidaceae bacterium]
LVLPATGSALPDSSAPVVTALR